MNATYTNGTDSIRLCVKAADVDRWLADPTAKREIVYAYGDGFAGLAFKDTTNVAILFGHVRKLSTIRGDTKHPRHAVSAAGGSGQIALVQRKINDSTYAYIAQRIKQD